MDDSYTVLKLDEKKKIELQKICSGFNITIENCLEKLIDALLVQEPGILSIFSSEPKIKKKVNLESVIIKKNSQLKSKEIDDLYDLIDNE